MTREVCFESLNIQSCIISITLVLTSYWSSWSVINWPKRASTLTGNYYSRCTQNKMRVTFISFTLCCYSRYGVTSTISHESVETTRAVVLHSCHHKASFTTQLWSSSKKLPCLVFFGTRKRKETTLIIITPQNQNKNGSTEAAIRYFWCKSSKYLHSLADNCNSNIYSFVEANRVTYLQTQSTTKLWTYSGTNQCTDEKTNSISHQSTITSTITSTYFASNKPTIATTNEVIILHDSYVDF